MKSLQWLKSIDVRQHLSGDTELLYQECGIETLIALWEKLPSLSLYISTKPLNECKKVFIRKEYNGSNVKQLARTLNVSERFVMKVISEPAGSKPRKQRRR